MCLGRVLDERYVLYSLLDAWYYCLWTCADQTLNLQQGEEGLGGLPNDAVTQGKKDRIGLADTTNEDSAARKAAGEK